tara:strand:+ start:294 stop:638 length:345 start_codon:yes stop_codon:yes gene_type:complete
MLNSKDIPYVREDRLHNEMKFLQEKRNYLMGRLRDSRGKNSGVASRLREVETQVCYVYREIEKRRLRKEAHASYLKKKNYQRNRNHRDNNTRGSRENNYRNNRDNRANRTKKMV